MPAGPLTPPPDGPDHKKTLPPPLGRPMSAPPPPVELFPSPPDSPLPKPERRRRLNTGEKVVVPELLA
jgi:hypothetical protein